MKKVFLCLTIFLTLLFSCSQKKDDVDDPNDIPNNEIVIESIKVVTRSGKNVTEDSCFVSDEGYTHDDIYVWAVYSDSSHKDVTTNSEFSTVDISTIGDKEVQVTYLNFSTKYTLHVLENSVSGISIDYTNCSIIYKVGQIFSDEGLSVVASFADGTSTVVYDYQLSVKNEEIDLKKPLTDVGKYTINVSYANYHKEFKIVVYDEKNSEYSYKVDYILNDIYMGDKNSFYFYDKVYAINNSVLNMSVINTNICTKEDNNENVHLEYNNETYNSYISIPTSDGIEITIKNDSNVLLLVGGLNNTSIYFKNVSTREELFGHNSKNATLLYCSLKAGTYNLVSNKSNARLYGISLSSENVHATDISLDTTNVKKDYIINETLSLAELKVYYVLNDGTTSLADLSNITYKIYNQNNEEVTLLNQGGNYDVEIILGNLTKKYQISVIDNRSFSSIALDYDDVKTIFYEETFNYDYLKVYGVSTSGNVLLQKTIDYKVELTLDGSVVSNFTNYGNYVVKVTYIGSGCENNEAYYNVKFSKIISGISLDTTNVKTDYIKGDQFDITGLNINLKFVDNTYETLPLNQIQKYIYYNNNLVSELNEIGTYKVVIKYNDYSSDYEINISDITSYNDIELDLINVKVSFNGEDFNTNNLKVYGNEVAGGRVLIPLADLEITLLHDNTIVTNFSSTDTYTVNVKYIGDIPCTSVCQTYSVSYQAPKKQFGYSGPDLENYLDSWEEEIIYPIDYKSYIRVPNSNYLFQGFSPTFDDDFVKINVGKKDISKTMYCYVSPRYEYITYNYTGDEPTPEWLKDDETFIRYVLDEELSTNNYKLYYALCSTNTVDASISIESATTASITFEGLNPTSINAYLIDSNGSQINISNNNTTFDNLDLNMIYTLKGSITCDNIVYSINEIDFSTALVRNLSTITDNDTVLNVSSTTLEIDCTQYISLAPNGYTLVAFQLLDENNIVQKELEYDGVSQTVYFTNLTENTTYQVAACYGNIENMCSDTPSKPKYTYGFRFIGYTVLTYGDKNYRVRMQYNGDTLYTWYLNNKNWLTSRELCNFALPIELFNYEIIGCKEQLYNISKDMDVEVILVEKSKTYITFYGFQGQLIDYYEDDGSDTIKYPNVASTVTYNGWTYDFDGWFDYGRYEHHATYRIIYSNLPTTLSQSHKFYIFTDKLYAYGYMTMYPYNVDYIHRIYDDKGNDITDTLTLSGDNSNGIYFEGLNPNTNYIYKATLYYNLNDGNGNQYYEYTYEFKTMTISATKNIIVTVQEKEPQHLGFKTNKNNYDSIIIDYIEGMTYIDNNEYLEWNTFDLCYTTCEKLYIYYADKIINDTTTTFKVYPQVVTYNIDVVDEVEVESITVTETREEGILGYITIKGKNAGRVLIWMWFDLDIPEFDNSFNNLYGHGMQALFSKKISDDEAEYIIYHPSNGDGLFYDCHLRYFNYFEYTLKKEHYFSGSYYDISISDEYDNDDGIVTRIYTFTKIDYNN